MTLTTKLTLCALAATLSGALASRAPMAIQIAKAHIALWHLDRDLARLSERVDAMRGRP